MNLYKRTFAVCCSFSNKLHSIRVSQFIYIMSMFDMQNSYHWSYNIENNVFDFRYSQYNIVIQFTNILS